MDSNPPPSRRRPAEWRANLLPALDLLLFGAALWGVDHALRDYRPADVARALGEISPPLLLLALAIALAGFVALAGYDRVALQVLGRPVPFRKLLMPSFVAFAVANVTPASALTSAGMRYRMYRPLGIDAAEAAAVAGIGGVTYAVGLAVVLGLVLVLHPATVPYPGAGIVGGALLAGAAAYVLVASRRRRPFRLFGRTAPVPGARLALAQIGVSCADWLLSSGALYVLVAAVGPVPYVPFLGAFLVAQMAALFLPVPGGLGVFEAVVLLQGPGGASSAELLAALLAYRVVYYLVPLVVAGAYAVGRAGLRARSRGAGVVEFLEWTAGLAPRLLAITTFLAGVLLLGTGALPAGGERLAWLADVLPLSLIAASHFLGSIVGAALVVLAWGLERRSRLAFRWVRALYLAGIVLSLGRGLDWRVAGVLAACLLVVALSSRAFPRPTPLAREPIGTGWIFAVGAALLLSVWVGRFSHFHRVLPSEPWWRYALYGGAPPWIRAGLGAAVAVALFSLARLLGRHAPEPSPSGGDVAPEESDGGRMTGEERPLHDLGHADEGDRDPDQET